MNDERRGGSALEKVEGYYLGCAKVVIALVAVAAVFAGILVFSIIHASRQHWPPIKEPELLVRDCRMLMATYAGNPTPNQWPQSVRDLHPIQVMVNKQKYVYLPFSFGGALQNGEWGYLVFNNLSEAQEYENDGKMKKYPTDNPLVFKWQ